MTYQLIIFLRCKNQDHDTVNFSMMVDLVQRPVIGRILEGLPTGPFRVEQEIGENTSYAQSLLVSPENRQAVIAEFQKKGWVRYEI